MDADLGARPEAVEAQQLVESTVAIVANYRVSTAEQYQDGAALLKRVKSAQAEIEAKRTKITKPLNASLQATNDLFRPYTEKLLEAERAIKHELTRFSDEQERLRRQEQARAEEAARKARERIEAQALKAAEAGKVEKAEALELRAAAVVAPVIQREAPRVSGIIMRKVPRFEIVDAGKLPREYLIADEKKIGGVVRALRTDANIPGIRVWMEDQIAAGAA